MMAVLYRHFGGADVLEYREAPEPAIPEAGVVIAMRATSLNVIVVDRGGRSARDALQGRLCGVRRGKRLQRRSVRPKGRRRRNRPCGKAPGVSFEHAAALPTTGLAALYSLREVGQVRSGQRVLIHGGSGAPGLIAIQFGKMTGAEVTSVSGACGAGAARAAGADVALDYRATPVLLKGPFDLIVNFSSALPFAAARPLLTRTGRFVEASPTITKFAGSLIANRLRRRKHLMLQTVARAPDLEYIAGLVVDGRLEVTIAATFALERAKGAFLKQEGGGTIGKIVLARRLIPLRSRAG